MRRLVERTMTFDCGTRVFRVMEKWNVEIRPPAVWVGNMSPEAAERLGYIVMGIIALLLLIGG